MSETTTVLTVAVGLFAATCAVPTAWHAGMGLLYVGIPASELASGGTPDPTGLAFLAFFEIGRAHV
jgi:hypothetical protein